MQFVIMFKYLFENLQTTNYKSKPNAWERIQIHTIAREKTVRLLHKSLEGFMKILQQSSTFLFPWAHGHTLTHSLITLSTFHF